MAVGIQIINSLHPFWTNNYQNWFLWRLCWEGGDRFTRHYLKQFSRRESYEDFSIRREITYCPGFAKKEIKKIKSKFLQRMSDVTRYGGPLSYQRAIHGLDEGVDLKSSSMNSYLGIHVIEELLVMSRVGIFVDMPKIVGATLAGKKDRDHPYIYLYRTEQIRSWTYDPQNPEILTSVLLEEEKFAINENTGLTIGLITNYRHMWLETLGGYTHVVCLYYNSSGEILEGPFYIEMDQIPFIILEISSSLLADVARYQVALLNLESSDLLYTLKSNFPFYTEQFDQRTKSPYLQQPGREVREEYKSDVRHVAAVENVEEITVGISSGRRYPIGAERPQFINPSSEPLKASMEKGEQIKKDIRELVNLSVENLEAKKGTATQENGLAYIGLELERAEQQIALFWSKYEGSKDLAIVKYPETYELRSDEEIETEAKSLSTLIPQIASNTFRKEAMKRIVSLTIGNRLSYDMLQKIEQEIDEIPTVHSDPEVITKDLENGIVGLNLASKMRGYPEGEVDRAKQDHSDRIARIAMAQTPGMGYGARGVGDLSLDGKEGKVEKQLAREDSSSVVPSDNGRGEGRD